MTGNADGTERILGTLRSADGTGVVRMEDRLHTAVEDVWSALTDPSQLAHWYGEVNGDLRLGGEYPARLLARGWGGTRRLGAGQAAPGPPVEAQKGGGSEGHGHRGAPGG